MCALRANNRCNYVGCFNHNIEDAVFDLWLSYSSLSSVSSPFDDERFILTNDPMQSLKHLMVWTIPY